MDTNPTKGFYIIRNALVLLLFASNEAEQKTEDACLFKSIEVWAIKFPTPRWCFLEKELRQNPTNLVNPPDVWTPTFHVRTSSSRMRTTQQLVHLPLLSSLIWCITEGLAHLPLPLTHIKGAILCGIESLKGDEHLEAILHSDFPADRSFFPSGSPQPMTVFFHLGPDPLELLMGSLTTRAPRNTIQGLKNPSFFSLVTWHCGLGASPIHLVAPSASLQSPTTGFILCLQLEMKMFRMTLLTSILVLRTGIGWTPLRPAIPITTKARRVKQTKQTSRIQRKGRLQTRLTVSSVASLIIQSTILFKLV